jgi:SAM-dependent methyltransferase
MLIKKAWDILKAEGVGGLLDGYSRRVLSRHVACYPQCKPYFRGRSGLEIGGPSSIFDRAGLIPVYPIAARVDNCTFSHHTIWEGDVAEGSTFYFDKRRSPGHQYIIEANDLSSIQANSYDFVISSHALEHMANPLQALGEWIRVLKGEGLLVLVVPNRDGTFDHLRPVTSFEHLVQDFQRRTTEGDMTHLEEILSLHDLARDPAAGSFEDFRERSAKNLENRCLHHHVFDTRLAVEMVHHTGLRILWVELSNSFHIVVVAQKRRPPEHV